MLHLFIGTDTGLAKADVRKAVQKDKSELILFGEGGASFEEVLGYVHSQGLFAPKVALLLDRPLETGEGKTFLKEYAAHLHDAACAVYIIEGALSAEDKKIFPKGVKPIEFGTKEKTERLLPFAMSDAFLRGDRKGAWIEYQKLIMAGAQIEEVHGTLSWAVRSALIAMKTKSATEAGLKPFVYTKSRHVGEKMGVERLEQCSRDLVHVYHDARSGKGTMALNLERLLLYR